MQPKVQVKGINEGILITLGEGDWQDARQAFLDHLDQQSEFLRGARLALDVGTHILKAAELGQLQKEISARDVNLWAVMSESPTTEQTAQSFGLAIRLGRTQPSPSAPPIETRFHDGEQAIFVRRTLRSGYSIQYPGHVVIMGDVNPGAEIVSAGDVVVWGRLRGTVHAGAEGNMDAVVCALDLSPTQLRIANLIALTPKRRGKPQPEKAQIQNGQVVAELWDPKRER